MLQFNLREGSECYAQAKDAQRYEKAVSFDGQGTCQASSRRNKPFTDSDIQEAAAKSSRHHDGSQDDGSQYPPRAGGEQQLIGLYSRESEPEPNHTRRGQ